MEDGGNWFLYVAMIVIAFISWVFNKIQESTAARQRGEEFEQHSEERESERPRYDSQEERSFREQAEPEPVTPPPVPTAEDAMRKLMEALGGTVVKAPPPPPPREVSTTSREKPAKPEQPRMTAEERAALDRLKQRAEKQTVRRRKTPGNLASLSIADLVRDPDGIRKAVILREVLDRPRAERPWE